MISHDSRGQNKDLMLNSHMS